MKKTVLFLLCACSTRPVGAPQTRSGSMEAGPVSSTGANTSPLEPSTACASPTATITAEWSLAQVANAASALPDRDSVRLAVGPDRAYLAYTSRATDSPSDWYVVVRAVALTGESPAPPLFIAGSAFRGLGQSPNVALAAAQHGVVACWDSVNEGNIHCTRSDQGARSDLVPWAGSNPALAPSIDGSDLVFASMQWNTLTVGVLGEPGIVLSNDSGEDNVPFFSAGGRYRLLFYDNAAQHTSMAQGTDLSQLTIEPFTALDGMTGPLLAANDDHALVASIKSIYQTPDWQWEVHTASTTGDVRTLAISRPPQDAADPLIAAGKDSFASVFYDSQGALVYQALDLTGAPIADAVSIASADSTRGLRQLAAVPDGFLLVMVQSAGISVTHLACPASH